MLGEYRVVKFFMMVFGNALYSHIHFIDQLTARLHLREVVSEEESDIIIAFVAVVSRAGTDIEAALKEIASSRPVVLVVLHHTFDPNFVAPDSGLTVNRSDVFTVDCLFHEDKGLLRCERNDRTLKAVTDHLISKGALAWPQERLKSFLPRKRLTHIGQYLQQQKRILRVIIWALFGLFSGMLSGDMLCGDMLGGDMLCGDMLRGDMLSGDMLSWLSGVVDWALCDDGIPFLSLFLSQITNLRKFYCD
ncbi:uncharacterized protein LOC118817377 [Colossoma macropomum]|uniref:uncharacterized protein LOC118817377 n=1 Tax=Colossoma macropomum TaxID=42526 RepID=UPI001863F3FA|nr:uncharacterized protein LOC118817377 [Colossoma macropomum]